MHAAAANCLQITEILKIVANYLQTFFVLRIIYRIGMGLPDNITVNHLGFLPKTQHYHFPLGHLDQFIILHVPRLVIFIAKILHADTGLALIRYHEPAPVLEVLDAANLYCRTVDI